MSQAAVSQTLGMAALEDEFWVLLDGAAAADDGAGTLDEGTAEDDNTAAEEEPAANDEESAANDEESAASDVAAAVEDEPALDDAGVSDVAADVLVTAALLEGAELDAGASDVAADVLVTAALLERAALLLPTMPDEPPPVRDTHAPESHTSDDAQSALELHASPVVRCGQAPARAATKTTFQAECFTSASRAGGRRGAPRGACTRPHVRRRPPYGRAWTASRKHSATEEDPRILDDEHALADRGITRGACRLPPQTGHRAEVVSVSQRASRVRTPNGISCPPMNGWKDTSIPAPVSSSRRTSAIS